MRHRRHLLLGLLLLLGVTATLPATTAGQGPRPSRSPTHN
jgi:hypothetical protein